MEERCRTAQFCHRHRRHRSRVNTGITCDQPRILGTCGMRCAANDGKTQAGDIVGRVIPDTERKQIGISRKADRNGVDLARLVCQEGMFAVGGIDGSRIIEWKRLADCPNPGTKLLTGSMIRVARLVVAQPTGNDRNQKTTKTLMFLTPLIVSPAHFRRPQRLSCYILSHKFERLRPSTARIPGCRRPPIVATAALLCVGRQNGCFGE